MAVPKAQDYNKGHLGANNFTIGHDNSITKSTLKSVFKKDFPEHSAYGRSEVAKLPRLGDVMHVDEKFNTRASETATSFEYTAMAKPVLLGVANKFSHTNFKMDSDTSKVESFNTTHNHFFPPRQAEGRLKQIHTTQISSIPQGDREKADLPISDYKYKYLGVDTSKYRTERAKNMHNEGPPTIKGDERLGHFTSVSRTQFQGDWAPRVPILPVPRTLNVPIGDVEKENTKMSVMQSSFMNYGADMAAHKPFDTRQVSGKLRRTNYKERDGHGTWEDYETSMNNAYPAKTVDLIHHTMKHRNTSDFPEGDREPIRDKERMNLTTSKFYHGNPARGLHNRIVSGANKLTESQVWFGDPELQKNFYSTTTGEVFEPKKAPYTYDRQSHYKPTSIPVDYYKNNMTYEATASRDYPDPHQERMVPNPKALERISRSHIKAQAPHMNLSTTHQEQFTQKPLNKFLYDSGRMQKSSVPLGTMAH